MGEVLTGEGMQASKKKAETTVDASRPQNRSEDISAKFSRVFPILCKIHPWVFGNIKLLVRPHMQLQALEVGHQGRRSF